MRRRSRASARWEQEPKPAASTRRASSRLFSHVADQLSGAVVIAMPPLQLEANRPSLSRLALAIEPSRRPPAESPGVIRPAFSARAQRPRP